MDMTEQLLRLPEGFVVEILSRLPVQTLLKFRVVSKSWRSLIDSKSFIKSHLQNSKTGKLCISSRCGYDDSQHSTNPITVGSCNGLLCVLVRVKLLFLWNPSARTFEKLPDIDPDNENPMLYNLGFGWEESRDEYKVFAIMRESTFDYGVKSKVYGSKTNSWRTLTLPYKEFSLSRNTLQLVNGKLHWIHSDKSCLPNRHAKRIASLDLKTESFRMIEAPTDIYDHTVDFGVLDGCLCILSYVRVSQNDGVEAWVMKEYGMRESWVKHIVVWRALVTRPPPWSRTVSVGADGKIQLVMQAFTPRREQLAAVDLDGEILYFMGTNVMYLYQTYIHTESLVSAKVYEN